MVTVWDITPKYVCLSGRKFAPGPLKKPEVGAIGAILGSSRHLVKTGDFHVKQGNQRRSHVFMAKKPENHEELRPTSLFLVALSELSVGTTCVMELRSRAFT